MTSLVAAVARLRQWSVVRLSIALGVALIVPGLGAVGLWDPWETHYVEVGRQMLARADLVHPYWQNAWFFSKPPLTPWLSALGLWLSGAQGWGEPGTGPLPSSMEWAVRAPFAALLIAAGAMVADLVARGAGRRAGLLTALVWNTTPLVLFMSRQVMTDGPFVACLVISLCAAERARRDAPAWWWLAFGATALAVLSKGLIGLLAVPVVLVSWLIVDGAQALALVRRVPWRAALLLPVLAAPWFIVMARFEGLDDEGRTFVERFFVYDHLNRFTSGVHTTTPGGTFTYFFEQAAWALTPWLVLVPAAFQVVATTRRDGERWRLVVLFAVLLATTFTVFSVSATRFHHYVFSMIPALVVLVALAADAVWDDPAAFRPALLCGGLLQGLVARDLIAKPRHWLDLFTYNHDRPYPNELVSGPLWNGTTATLQHALTLFGVVAAGGLLLEVVRRRGWALMRVQLVVSATLACFVSFHHWPRLSRHWTQRALVDRYFAERGPGERLGAFLMNWKGETLYTRSEVIQLAGRDLRAEVAALTSSAARTWFVVEHQRLEVLRQTLPPGWALSPVDAESTNKFALVVATRTR